VKKGQLKWHAKSRGEKSRTLHAERHKKKQLKMTSVPYLVRGVMTSNELKKAMILEHVEAFEF
jgi:hypothetical protein